MTLRASFAVAAALLAGAQGARADYIDHFAAPDDIGTLKIPRVGATHILVIPVIIDDLPFEEGSEQGFVDDVDAFYAPDATGWAFTPYYDTVSLGRFHPEAVIADPVHFPTCPPLGQFQNCEIPRGAGAGEGDLQSAAGALGDALRFFDEIVRCATVGPSAELTCTSGGGVDLHDADTSGPVQGTPDGVTDGVILISNADFPGIALPVKDIASTPLFNQLLGPLPSFEHDGVTVGAVAVAGRATPPQHATFVSVHEFGHLLGWCDLYNESGTTADMPYTLMGGWYYQDPGSLPDGFSRMAAGFAHVVQVAKSGTFDIAPADLEGTVLKVGTGDEFFTVELRRKTDATDGDMSIDAGVVVERVRLQKRPSPDRGQYLNTLSSCVNCTAFDTFLNIEQPSQTFDLEAGRPRNDTRDMFQAGDTIAPSDDTAPRSLAHEVYSTNRFDGTPTGVTISVLEADAQHAKIDVSLTDEVADPCAEIAPYCGALTCTDGACGARPKPAVTPPPDVQGCGCASSSSPADLAGLVGLLGLALRRRRR